MKAEQRRCWERERSHSIVDYSCLQRFALKPRCYAQRRPNVRPPHESGTEETVAVSTLTAATQLMSNDVSHLSKVNRSTVIVISVRSKVLIGGVSLAPLSLAIIWFYQFRVLREIQNHTMSVEQALQFQASGTPVWLPKLLRFVFLGAFRTIPLIVSLFLDNRRTSTRH